MSQVFPLPPGRPVPAESLARMRAELVLAAAEPRRSRRTWELVGLVAAAAAVGAVAIGIGLTSQTHPPRAQVTPTIQKPQASQPSPPGPSTAVSTLIAYRHTVRAVDETDLPAGVRQGLAHAELRFGGTPTNVQEPIAGTPSIYLVTLSSDVLCMYVVLSGSVGSCNVALREAGGSLSVSNVIVDGKAFVAGLAANDVSSISVSLAGTSRTPATTVQAEIVNNVYLAPLPYNGGPDLGAVTITATRADGSTGTATMPGSSCSVCEP